MTHVFNWHVFFEELPGGGEEYWQLLVSGIGWTLAVSACAWVIALLLGSVIGTVRRVLPLGVPVTPRQVC